MFDPIDQQDLDGTGQEGNEPLTEVGECGLHALLRHVPNLAVLAMSFVLANDDLIGPAMDAMGKRHNMI